MSSFVLRAAIVIASLWGIFAASPSGTALAQNAQTDDGMKALGKAVFEGRCAICHGMQGDGKGVAAPLLAPKPRSFTEGKFKFRSTESGTIPLDEDIRRSVSEGLHSTAMPDWKTFIGGDSLTAVIEYVKMFSPRFRSERPKAVNISQPVPSSPSSINAGIKVYAKLQCASCHGTDGNGKDAVAKDLADDWGNAIPTPKLTEPWTFRRGASAKDVFLDVRTGIDGTPMPSFIGSATDQELWHLANYVISLGRKPVWSMDAGEVEQFYAGLRREESLNKIEHGKTLVEMRGCVSCHSTFDAKGMLVDEMQLAGGLKWTLGPYGAATTMNLTSDKETGIGDRTDEELKRAITKGIRKDGSRMIPFPMGWTAYANLTESDLDAIIAYLRSVPPVYNKIPPPEPLGFMSYMWAKFKMLVLKEDIVVYSPSGNAGTAKEAGQ